MVNLTELTRLSGHGAGLDAMSRQFGLDPVVTSKAVEALLPAFTLAFQRLALNPIAFADVAKSVASGNYAAYFDNPSQAQAATSGASVVAQLFRSPEASRQVASQAAALTGVGVQVVQQMMPALAATLVGGMFRYATVEGFADVLRQWGDALRAASERLDPPKPQDPWSAWQAAAGRMMGLQPALEPARPEPPRPGPLVDPKAVFDAWLGMVGVMTGTAAARDAQPPDSPPPLASESARREPSPEPHGDAAQEASDGEKTTSSSGEPNPFEAMSQMFETGREVHAQHVAALQSILDTVWVQNAADPARPA